MIAGIKFIKDFCVNSFDLFNYLEKNIEWDERMSARKTASFGVAYNYSQIGYPFQKMLPEIKSICKKINEQIGFEPNNCLVNLYIDGKSKMGYHSDQIDILEGDTGVVIISLGDTRTLRFRRIENKEEKINYKLPSGSLLYMNQEVQKVWQHSIPKSNSKDSRMSLTFRKIK